MTAGDLSSVVAQREWYHTMELPGGVTTPGFFDHRPVLDRYELPADLRGRRVLDVGTFDGYFAFEFERRGAEVVAIDVPDEASLDWPEPLRPTGNTRFQPEARNFDVAREALGSSVQRIACSVYDATPERLGDFDLVFVGSLLIHLRDPVGALMALRGVCRGQLWAAEEVHAKLDRLSPRTPVAKFQAISPHLTWWVPNRAALEHWLLAAGFLDVAVGKPFVVPFRERPRSGVRHAVARGTAPTTQGDPR